jgi:hypothetical protein
MGRLGTPEEMANVIVFTALPRAHWINGRQVPVDGLSQPTRCAKQPVLPTEELWQLHL